jgi:hypothetical protein
MIAVIDDGCRILESLHDLLNTGGFASDCSHRRGVSA